MNTKYEIVNGVLGNAGVSVTFYILPYIDPLLVRLIRDILIVLI